MDMLFSPYGLGGMPKSAMAEIERRTEELLKSSSFHRMLELEKQYKMERLHGPQPLLPSSELPVQLKNGPPPRPERKDSLFPHDAFLMVEPTRRAVIPPSLSITIPEDVDNGRQTRQTEWGPEQEADDYTDVGTPTNSEPLQKQVKFLAPEDEHDPDDAMSEQSSICQSPSWEGYGQRKKEKKLEAERKKREKEQAEKEAKAAKKRTISRLSKAPPLPATTSHDTRPNGLTVADRSMSDPLLVSRHLLQSTQSMHRPDDVGRTISADNLQQSRWHRPAVTEVLSGSNTQDKRAAGGISEDPSSSATFNHSLHDNGISRQGPRRSISEGPGPLTQHPPMTVSARHESRSPRDAFPPSASRTPRLRHISPAGGSRSNPPFQGAPSANNSQESLSMIPAADGARRNGYVDHQRAQAAERAMAGLADEQLAKVVSQYYPPSSSSSGQTQNTRRSSLSQEAKSAAMKFVGIRSSARDSADQIDYLTFKAIPYSSSDTSVSAGIMPASPRSVDGTFRVHDNERPTTSGAALSHSTNGVSEHWVVSDRPSTSQSSVGSSDPSVAGSGPGNNNRKSRNLKDAAKAALSMSKGSDSPKQPVSVPPFLKLRARLHSRTSIHAENKTAHAVVKTAPEVTPSPAVTVSVTDQAKPATMASQGDSRVSEGSSSSSAYEDGSAIPSPTTTPDTSRPQSAKDFPLNAPEHTRETSESAGLQDDERTLRQSLDSSKSSTPRLRDSEVGENIEMGNEDRWSRTALPIEIDCDAESFMTTVSNFDNIDNSEQASPRSPTSPHVKKDQPESLKLASKTSPDSVRSTEAPISIPPRSRKRSQSQTTYDGSPVSPVAPPQADHRNADMGRAQGVARATEELGGAVEVENASTFMESRNFARTFEQKEEKVERDGVPERYKRLYPRNASRPQESPMVAEHNGHRDEGNDRPAPASPRRDWTSGSTSAASSTVPSAGPASPRALTADCQIPSNPYFAEIPEPLKHHEILGEMSNLAGPPSPMSLPSPLHQVFPKAPAPRANSAPIPSLASSATSRASTPATRASGIVPVSILKQPKTSSTSPEPAPPPATSRPQVLSALPKHMQLQAGLPVRPPATAMAPIAKMFVECCSCKFYHDMPSKLYECMAKPDAVVEDKLLGISGAITTMVKCPWCHHNMSRNCCSGYAAVVYLKEKLH